MTPLLDLQKVQAIAHVAGIAPDKMTPLSQGATSCAWRVDSAEGVFIVRFMPEGVQRPVTYQSEFMILRLLLERGCPVPRPVVNSIEANPSAPGLPGAWAVTRLVTGAALKQDPIVRNVALVLGRMLAVVHALPVQGYGRLVETPYSLAGQQTEALAGVLARWCFAPLWPFDGSDLRLHAIARLQPQLLAAIQAHEDTIVGVLHETPAVLTHSDLHGEHLFHNNGTLSGVIDFGAAFIGHPAWEFAVLAYYHGWPAVRAALSGYTDRRNRARSWPSIRVLALVIGLYKLSKAVKAQAPVAKTNRILKFLSSAVTEEVEPDEFDNARL
jgi:aminoglycoside phosphotransferase (APT) family kinase protein